MVGATGFEPATSCSRSRRATKLRYAPYLRPYTRAPSHPESHDSQAYLPDQLHEHAPGVPGDPHHALHLVDHLSVWLATSPTGITIRPPSASCSNSGGGTAGPPAATRMRSNGASSGHPSVPLRRPHPHVAVPEPFQRLARPRGQPRQALHRAHPRRQLREHRGLVAAARARPPAPSRAR